MCVCVCVCVCVFFPFILDIKFVGRTSRGHTGGRSHRISHPPSFCGACLDFSSYDVLNRFAISWEREILNFVCIPVKSIVEFKLSCSPRYFLQEHHRRTAPQPSSTFLRYLSSNQPRSKTQRPQTFYTRLSPCEVQQEPVRLLQSRTNRSVANTIGTQILRFVVSRLGEISYCFGNSLLEYRHKPRVFIISTSLHAQAKPQEK